MEVYICIISSLETKKQFWIYLLLVQQQPTGSASMADNRNDDIAIIKQKHMTTPSINPTQCCLNWYFYNHGDWPTDNKLDEEQQLGAIADSSP